MAQNPFLTDTTGPRLTTEDGTQILVAMATQNDDIELFDYSVDLLRAILWQYNEAEHLQSLLTQKQLWYNNNQLDFWFNWYYDVFNLETANDFGCSVWSIILNLPLFVNTPPSPIDKPTFGFDASYFKNFNRGNFSSRTGGTSGLALEMKRLALRLRYFQLVTSGTVPEINRFMKYLFEPYGHVYLIDGHNMTQLYIFDFDIPAQMRFLFNNFDLLPRPSGVGSTYRSTVTKFFGFGPSWNRTNFNRGNFQQ